MPRKILVLLAGGLLCGQAVLAQELHFTVLSGFDLDGEAADADQVVTAANGVLADSTTYVLTADPDKCRLLDLTIVDTDLSAGTITVTGTDCLGDALVATFAWTAGDDTGVKTLTVSSGVPGGAYFKTVTEVATGVLTGEGTETFTLGYSTNPSNEWCVFGLEGPNGLLGEHVVNPLASAYVALPITTSNVLTTAVASVASNNAFTNILAGDLLLISQVDGEGKTVVQERVVTVRTSEDAITVNAAIKIPTVGVAFRWKRPFCSTNPYDQLWIPVGGWNSASFTWSIDSSGNTGGIVSSLQCADVTPDWPTSPWVEIGPGDTNCTIATPTCTVTTATGVVQTPFSKTVDLSLASFTYCRFGAKFGTGDDTDATGAATEDINLGVSLRK